VSWWVEAVQQDSWPEIARFRARRERPVSAQKRIHSWDPSARPHDLASASVRMTGVDGLDVASHLRKLKITLFAAFFMLCIDVDRRDGRDRSTSPRSEEQHLTADEH